MPIRTIYADISELLDGAPTLVLDADAAAGATSITVRSITGVAVNNILLFREPGNESAEIVATHAATAPSGNTVTLVAAGLVEAHPAGTTIYIIRANQVRFYSAATEIDANADDTGVTALAAAQAIDPTTRRNLYRDTVQTSGFYYWRFIDSINSINLLYSDPIPWGQIQVEFADDEVGFILEFVRRKLGIEWDQRFSKQTAIDEINACLDFIGGKLKKWSTYQTFNNALGQTSRGVFSHTLPTDMYDRNTNRSILQVRLGANTRPLAWRDEKEFEDIMGQVKRTTVRTLAVVGATTLAIVNSYDFDSSGSVTVFSSNTGDTITYTGVTRSATVGVLTGISATGSGAIGAAHAVGQNVWQDYQEGEPLYFNVKQGTLYYWPLPDANWVNFNVWLDYYTGATRVNSESDTIDAPRYDMVKHWLLWQGKNYTRRNGMQDLQDGDYLMFRDILSEAIRKEISGQKHKMSPKINQILYRPVRSRGFRYD